MKSIIQFFRGLSTLSIALGISVLLHGVLLTLRFVDPERFNRVFEDTPLEVVLVNARSDRVPDKVQAIAQNNLEGGGDSEDKTKIASSPAPMSSLNEWGEDMEEQERKANQLLDEQVRVLTQAREKIFKAPQYTPEQLDSNPDARAEQEKRLALLNQLGIIEKRINEENSRPKKRFVSPSTRAGVHSIYYSQLRDKIEERGTKNFPTVRGKRLYGTLTMVITVDRNGAVAKTEIYQSSGNPTLDRLARAIVRSGAPYGKFDQNMLKEFQMLVVATTFKFSREEGLQTSTQDLRQGLDAPQ